MEPGRVERWAVVREGGRAATEGRVELLELVELVEGDGLWYPPGLPGLGCPDPRSATVLFALHRGWCLVEVCGPERAAALALGALRAEGAGRAPVVGGEPEALAALAGLVTVRLTRESAYAWRRLLAQWAAIGTLGEPGEELARELAAALGEGAGG